MQRSVAELVGVESQVLARSVSSVNHRGFVKDEATNNLFGVSDQGGDATLNS